MIEDSFHLGVYLKPGNSFHKNEVGKFSNDSGVDIGLNKLRFDRMANSLDSLAAPDIAGRDQVFYKQMMITLRRRR